MGAPIAVVALFRRGRGINAKTGGVVQTYIVPDIPGLSLMAIMRAGLDVSVCGGCPHRYAYDKNGVAVPGTRTCYVNLGQGVRSVLKRLHRGGYEDVSSDPGAIAEIGLDRVVRLGTWGDPAAVPADVWAQLLSWSIGHMGYTHQWRSARLRAPIVDVVMASCETPADVSRALSLGFNGTFRVRAVFEGAPDRAKMCPASEEAGKVATCEQCKRCNGQGGETEIIAHGSMRGRYLPTLQGVA